MAVDGLKPSQTRQPIDLPSGDFLELEFHLTDSKAGVTPEAFVTELVQRWLAVEYWIRADQCRIRFESQQLKRAASKMAVPRIVSLPRPGV